MEDYLGAIACFGFSRIPVGWMACSGQLVNIADYTPLFNLIGITYGGDGTTTFGLPNLNGRFPIGPFPGNLLGATGGAENTMVQLNNIPVHAHLITASNMTVSGSLNVQATLQATSDPAIGYEPLFSPAMNAGAPAILAQSVDANPNSGFQPAIYNNDENPGVLLNGLSVTAEDDNWTVNTNGAQTGTTGNSIVPSIPIIPPFLALNFCICTIGLSPIPSSSIPSE